MTRFFWVLLIVYVFDLFFNIAYAVRFFAGFNDSYVAQLPGRYHVKFSMGAIIGVFLPVFALYILIRKRYDLGLGLLWLYVIVKVWAIIIIAAQLLGGFAKNTREFWAMLVSNSGWDFITIAITISYLWYCNSSKPRNYFCDNCITTIWNCTTCPACGKRDLKPAS